MMLSLEILRIGATCEVVQQRTTLRDTVILYAFQSAYTQYMLTYNECCNHRVAPWMGTMFYPVDIRSYGQSASFNVYLFDGKLSIRTMFLFNIIINTPYLLQES